MYGSNLERRIFDKILYEVDDSSDILQSLLSRDNITMELGEIVWGSIKWIHLAQYRDQCRALVNTVMKLRVP
jgi:hypothetical protein